MFKKQTTFKDGNQYIKKNGIYVPTKTVSIRTSGVWKPEKDRMQYALVLLQGTNGVQSFQFGIGGGIKATTVDLFSLSAGGVETLLYSVAVAANSTSVGFTNVPARTLIKFREFELTGAQSTHAFYSNSGAITDIVSFGDNYKARCYPRLSSGAVATLPIASPHPYIRTMNFAFNRNVVPASVGDIDVSLIEDFTSCFLTSGLSTPLNKWNTANALNMTNMIRNCYYFDQNISGWNVSKVSVWTGFKVNCPISVANTPPKFR